VAETRGISQLRQAGVDHLLHGYRYTGQGPAAGEAAEQLGIEPERMWKSLVACADEELVFALLPATSELSLKKLAAAAGAKHAHMAPPKDAERATGYQLGGISPLGSRRPLRVFVDQSALEFERMCLNAGGRGKIVELATPALFELTSATAADLRAAAGGGGG
jgi:Cys-tRNA(Pro)/Cys-tRNA(Cys) deacylase